MKILFYSPYFYPYISGLTTYPWKILNYLSKRHKITVLTFNLSKNSPARNATHSVAGGMKIIYLPYLFKISKGFISPQSLLIFYQEASKADLIILNIPNFEGLPLAVFSRLLNKKIFSLFHCQVKLDQNFINRTINFFLNTSVFIQLLLSNKIIAHTKDYINSLSVGNLFKNKIITSLPPVEKLKVSNQLLNKLLEEKNGNYWIGFCGRIAQEKGIEYLIKAVSNLLGTPGVLKSNRKLHIVFAGPYGNDVAWENKYYQKIKEQLDKNKINYRFLGNLSDNELGTFYKAIDLLVLPSINQTEAFGMVQAEAMLLGTPVIATLLPGVKIPIQRTKMGLLVRLKNSAQITQAIKKILSSKNKYTNQTLITKAQKIFDINKVYKFYENIINL